MRTTESPETLLLVEDVEPRIPATTTILLLLLLPPPRGDDFERYSLAASRRSTRYSIESTSSHSISTKGDASSMRGNDRLRKKVFAPMTRSALLGVPVAPTTGGGRRARAIIRRSSHSTSAHDDDDDADAGEDFFPSSSSSSPPSF